MYALLVFRYRKCPDVLDDNDKGRWEEIILAFIKANQVKVRTCSS